MSLTSDEVVICNQSLDRIGATNFTYAVQTSIEAVRCNTNYVQTRDVLLRSFEWPFACARKKLSPTTNTPDFEWNYQYKLPDDYLRFREDYNIDDTLALDDRFEIEGDLYLTNDDEVQLKYIRKVTDPNEFDPLFTEILILRLALKLVPPVAGTKNIIRDDILKELAPLISQARTICRQETNVSGRSDWNLARNES